MRLPQGDSGFLDFADVTPPGRKTRVILVDSRRHGGTLAVVKWYARWRQYAFQPEADTVWSDGCLQDVQALLKELKAERAIAHGRNKRR